MNNFLKSLIVGGLFLMPFVVLVVDASQFFPFITGKAFVFRVLAEIVLALWLILAIRNPEYRPKISWLTIAVVAFVVLVGISNIFGANFDKSFWSNFERMEGYITILHLLGLFLVAGTVLKSEKVWTRFFHVSIVVSLIVAIYGILQLTGDVAISQGGHRIDGTFGNSIYLAIYMIFHIFLGAILFFRKMENKYSWIYIAVIILQIFIVYNTATRGAILGFIGGAILTAILVAIFGKDHPKIRKIAVGGLILLAIIIGSFLLVKDSDFVQESPVLQRFANISPEDKTTAARFMVWNMAWQGFQEQPILGWGQGNFSVVFNKYYNPKMFDQEPWFDRAHNIIFDWLIAGGALGLLAYLSIFVSALYLIWFSKNDSLMVVEKGLLTGLLGAYFFNNLFVFDNIGSYLMFFLILGYIHHHGDHKFELLTQKEFSAGMARVSSAIIVLLLIVGLWFFNWNGYQVSQTLVRAVNIQGVDSEGRPFYCEEVNRLQTDRRVCDKASYTLDLFKETTSRGVLGRAEARERLINMFPNFIRNESISDQSKQDLVALGISEIQKQVDKSPGEARYPYFLGIGFARIGQFEKSEQALEQALSWSPQKQIIMFELARIKLILGNENESAELFKRAYELDTRNSNLWINYVESSYDLGKVEVFNSLILEKVGQKDFEPVIQVYQDLSERYADNLQLRAALASSYLEAGNKQRAIEVLEKAIENDPSFEIRGRELIRDIEND